MGDPETLEGARLKARAASYEYTRRLRFLNNTDKHYAIPVLRYIMASYVSIPLRAILVGERPYSTDIHPPVSSAMSYDILKSRPTPSTIGISTDVSSCTGMGRVTVEEWARSSWKYLLSGVLVVNCMTFVQFSSSRSQSETIPFQRWIQAMIDCSIEAGGGKIDIVQMGIPASNVTDSIVSSMGVDKKWIRKHSYRNPAVISKGRMGDVGSHKSTFGKPGASLAISNIIKHCLDREALELRDYTSILTYNMSSQNKEISSVISSLNNLAYAVDDVYKDVENNPRATTLREAVDATTRALSSFRDGILKDVIAYNISKSSPESQKVGKATEWGGKKAWVKGPSTVGGSTRMSVVSESDNGVEQEIIKTPIPKRSDPVPDESPAPKPVKKTRTVKKMVRRPKAKPQQPEDRSENSEAQAVIRGTGSSVTREEESGLRTVLYYIKDTFESPQGGLAMEVSDTVDSGKVKSERVGIVLGVMDMTRRASGKGPEDVLGISSGIVDEDSDLARLLRKLCS